MILATKRGDREVRDASVGAMLAAHGLTRGSSGTSVNARTVGGLPAAKEAVRIAAEGVAVRQIAVFRGEDFNRRKVTSTWQARLFARRSANDMGDSWFDVFEALEASLTARNNGWWRLYPNDRGEVTGVQTLHPDCVEARWNRELNRPEYRHLVEGGGWSAWLGPDLVLHFRAGHVSPGSVVAPSPLELHRDALHNVVSKTVFEGRLYDEGILRSLAVTMPERMTAEQADEWRKVFQATHGGVDNAAKVRVFGGGATVETIGLSLQDAQYVESMQMGVEEVARVFGVPASLVGGGSQSTRPLSPEHEQMRWFEYGLEPRLARISARINAHPALFGPTARDYLAFLGVTVRADTISEAEADVKLVQAGIEVPDETRARRGLPPLPDGLGKIPQVTPVGGAPNPNVSTPPVGDDTEE